jgi:hypothetical protein
MTKLTLPRPHPLAAPVGELVLTTVVVSRPKPRPQSGDTTDPNELPGSTLPQTRLAEWVRWGFFDPGLS